MLNNISVEHDHGVLGISGPNGSGKSTLLKCLAGLESLTSGKVHWFRDDTELPIKELKTLLGFAAPYISLYGELTVYENLAFLAKARHEADKSAIDPLFNKLGLTAIRDQLFGSLSTGQQQRAKLASALFHNPKVLLLDEPGANLDEKGRALIEEIVRELKQKNRLVIIASNNPDELELCDNVFSVVN